MPRIASIDALEILDSRGNPTLRVRVRLDCGTTAVASVPSGASTGEHEARELRDDDAARFAGKGVRKAASHVAEEIAPALCGRDPMRQVEIDRLMIDLDDTPDKSRLGANAILGTSMAVARAAAAAAGLPLYAYLGGPGARRLPVPMMNVINGGAHADNSLDFQEFMLVPHGAPNFAEALRYGAETYHALRRILKARGLATAVGDEGGFAPNLPDNEAALGLIVEAIGAAGLQPGRQVVIALDPAASGFAAAGGYLLAKSGMGLQTSQQLTQLYAGWLDKYPIVSIEDGLGEHDWEGFRQHTAALGGRIQIGLTVTPVPKVPIWKVFDFNVLRTDFYRNALIYREIQLFVSVRCPGRRRFCAAAGSVRVRPWGGGVASVAIVLASATTRLMVARWTRKMRATAAAVRPAASMPRISVRCCASNFGRRPPVRPCARAVCRPARVRSCTIARSNSAKQPSICIIMRPAGPDVSIASVRERKLAPTASIFSRMCSRSLSERDRRSSFQTTSVSPSRS